MIDESSHQCEHIAATMSSLVKLPEAVIGFECLRAHCTGPNEVPRIWTTRITPRGSAQFSDTVLQ